MQLTVVSLTWLAKLDNLYFIDITTPTAYQFRRVHLGSFLSRRFDHRLLFQANEIFNFSKNYTNCSAIIIHIRICSARLDWIFRKFRLES